ncbi:hypothetical protein EYF80_006702 [Liparis tanakae]|uniref:Uncharacterized protein n=1 Tax=Liparis tanakae TaxID=230148 RepID=A0A4Z2IYM2_9TELE|nr:hypothetical protein EYF80_006702 [Liparis tanakae]
MVAASHPAGKGRGESCQSAGQKTIRPEGSFSARAHLPPPSLAADRLTLGRNPKLTLDVCEAQR